jgi:hypothetical protein
LLLLIWPPAAVHCSLSSNNQQSLLYLYVQMWLTTVISLEELLPQQLMMRPVTTWSLSLVPLLVMVLVMARGC